MRARAGHTHGREGFIYFRKSDRHLFVCMPNWLRVSGRAASSSMHACTRARARVCACVRVVAHLVCKLRASVRKVAPQVSMGERPLSLRAVWPVSCMSVLRSSSSQAWRCSPATARCSALSPAVLLSLACRHRSRHRSRHRQAQTWARTRAPSPGPSRSGPSRPPAARRGSAEYRRTHVNVRYGTARALSTCTCACTRARAHRVHVTHTRLSPVARRACSPGEAP